MARTLDVYLHNDLVGHLIQDDGGQILFDYNEAGCRNPTPHPCPSHCP